MSLFAQEVRLDSVEEEEPHSQSQSRTHAKMLNCRNQLYGKAGDCIDHSMDPEEHAEALLEAARSVSSLDEILHVIYTNHREYLLDVMYHQLQLISCRSQVLEDAQVTVYDRVLVSLTENNHDNPAAITWLCREYFRYEPGTDFENSILLIEQRLGLHNALNPGPRDDTRQQYPGHGPNLPDRRRSSKHGPCIESEKSDNPSRIESRSDSPIPTSPTLLFNPAYDPHSDATNVAMPADENWIRILDFYDKALIAYYLVADKESVETRDAARWLRDTAENALDYLERHKNRRAILDRDPQLLVKLQNTHSMALRVTERLTGGKKRKFDDTNIKSDRRERSAAPGPSSTRWPGNYHTHEVGRGRANTRSIVHNDVRGRYWDEDLEWARVDRTSRFGPTYDRDRGRRLDRDIERTQLQRERANSRISNHPRLGAGEGRRRGRGQRRGRGRGQIHSAIPYGYNTDRDVDSYIPGREGRR